MKKLIIIITMLLTINISYAADNQTPVDFIYIHGSDQGTVEEFEIWINRMHPHMKQNLEANAFVKEHMLKNSFISPEKDMLYWADKTVKDKSIVEVGLKISKLVSSCIAQLTRSTLAHLLHDAIWLQKYVNMQPILNELNTKIINISKNGEKTVLLGYSAGTFITYQYMIHKTRAINIVDMFEKFKTSMDISDLDIKNLKSTNPQPTCIDAIIDSNIAVMGADGNLIPVSNKQKLNENFKKLNSQTELSCAPENTVLGIINFGSPIVIFYSDNANSDSQLYYISGNILRYIIENNQFALTVNYKTDPLGVPAENMTISKIKQYDELKSIECGGGFLYDTSVKGGIIFASSHLKYWDQTNHFTKAVARSYEEGYKKFYEIIEK